MSHKLREFGEHFKSEDGWMTSIYSNEEKEQFLNKWYTDKELIGEDEQFKTYIHSSKNWDEKEQEYVWHSRTLIRVGTDSNIIMTKKITDKPLYKVRDEDKGVTRDQETMIRSWCGTDRCPKGSKYLGVNDLGNVVIRSGLSGNLLYYNKEGRPVDEKGNIKTFESKLNNIKCFESYTSSNYAPLYHSTDDILPILKWNGIVPLTQHNISSYNKNHKLRTKNSHKNILGISLSRDNSFTYRKDFTLVLDHDKIRNNYKIIPFDFFGDRKDSKVDRAKVYKSSLESEEFIIDKELKPLNKYLIAIRINDYVHGYHKELAGDNVFSQFADPDFKKFLDKELKKYPNVKILDSENTDITNFYFRYKEKNQDDSFSVEDFEELSNKIKNI